MRRRRPRRRRPRRRPTSTSHQFRRLITTVLLPVSFQFLQLHLLTSPPAPATAPTATAILPSSNFPKTMLASETSTIPFSSPLSQTPDPTLPTTFEPGRDINSTFNMFPLCSANGTAHIYNSPARASLWKSSETVSHEKMNLPSSQDSLPLSIPFSSGLLETSRPNFKSAQLIQASAESSLVSSQTPTRFKVPPPPPPPQSSSSSHLTPVFPSLPSESPQFLPPPSLESPTSAASFSPMASVQTSLSEALAPVPVSAPPAAPLPHQQQQQPHLLLFPPSSPVPPSPLLDPTGGARILWTTSLQAALQVQPFFPPSSGAAVAPTILAQVNPLAVTPYSPPAPPLPPLPVFSPASSSSASVQPSVVQQQQQDPSDLQQFSLPPPPSLLAGGGHCYQQPMQQQQQQQQQQQMPSCSTIVNVDVVSCVEDKVPKKPSTSPSPFLPFFLPLHPLVHRMYHCTYLEARETSSIASGRKT